MSKYILTLVLFGFCSTSAVFAQTNKKDEELSKQVEDALKELEKIPEQKPAPKFQEPQRAKMPMFKMNFGGLGGIGGLGGLGNIKQLQQQIQQMQQLQLEQLQQLQQQRIDPLPRPMPLPKGPKKAPEIF